MYMTFLDLVKQKTVKLDAVATTISIRKCIAKS